MPGTRNAGAGTAAAQRLELPRRRGADDQADPWLRPALRDPGGDSLVQRARTADAIDAQVLKRRALGLLVRART